MDNSNPNPVAPAATPAPAANPAPVQPPVSPAPSAPASSPTPTSGESKKPVLWLIIGLVIVAALVGGVYFFLSRQQAAENTQTTGQPIVQTTPKPPDTVDALDRDLSALNLDNGESDFSSVDSDLQQL